MKEVKRKLKNNSIISSMINLNTIAATKLMNYGTGLSSPLSDGEGKRGQPRYRLFNLPSQSFLNA